MYTPLNLLFFVRSVSYQRKVDISSSRKSLLPKNNITTPTCLSRDDHIELTLWSWTLLERPLDARPLDNFPAFHGTRMVNTEFTRALHLFLSLARTIQSTSPHPTSPRSILILFTHLCLGLPSGLLPSGFHTNNLYAFLFSPIRATWPTHLTLRDLIILIILGEEYKSRSSSLCSFLHSPVTSSLFGPDDHIEGG
jgi:hypothetical protein